MVGRFGPGGWRGGGCRGRTFPWPRKRFRRPRNASRWTPYPPQVALVLLALRLVTAAAFRLIELCLICRLRFLQPRGSFRQRLLALLVFRSALLGDLGVLPRDFCLAAPALLVELVGELARLFVFPILL